MKITYKAAVAAAVCTASLAWGMFIAVANTGALNSPSSAAGVAVPAPTSTAPDPAAILRRMHVPGITAGADYADGQYASGEQVAVYTFADRADEDAYIGLNPSNDVNKLLVGELFAITVTGVDEASGIVFPEPVAALAAQSGATAGQD